MLSQTRKFIGEVKTELAKATWPWDLKEKSTAKRYKELTDSTAVVVIGMLILSAFIGFWDFVLNTVIGWLTK